MIKGLRTEDYLLVIAPLQENPMNMISESILVSI